MGLSEDFRMKETDEQVKAKLAVMMRVFALEDAGKKEEAFALQKTIPLAPHIVKNMKELVGVEVLKQTGLNFSEAYAEYGQDFLDK
jgi:hypothetical protein